MPLLYLPNAGPLPAYDNSANSGWKASVASGVATTWTHNPTTAGSYAIVAACSANQASNVTAAATTAVTFGGQTMASLGNVYCSNLAAQGFVWVWGLANAPGGSNTVSVTFTQAGLTFEGWCSSYTYNAVASVGALQTAFNTANTSNSISLSVPSGPGQLVWAALANNSSFMFTSPGALTIRQQNPNANNWPGFAGGDVPGSASTSITGTTALNSDMAVAGLNLL